MTGTTCWAGEAFEQELRTWVEQSLGPVRAADPAPGFLLTPDQGEVVGFEHRDLATWSGMVRSWALVQRALVGRVEEMRAVGVPLLRPEDAVTLALERAEALVALPAHDPRRLGPESRDAVLAATGEVQRAVDVVGGLGLPLSLDHNDLHGANVFPGPPLRFFDLGDALLTHPMAVLLTPLSSLVALLQCDLDDVRLAQVAEAWIEVWSDVAPAARLREALPHALRLAQLGAHEAWWRATHDLAVEELGDFGGGGAECLAALAARPVLAGGPGTK